MRWLVYVNFLVPLLLEEFFNPIEQLLGFIEQSFNYLLKLILNIANFLFLLLVRVANFLLATVRVLAHGLRHVISDIIHGRFRHLFEDYLRLKAKLRAFFEPVLRVLRRIRQIFDQFFKQFIAPVLNLLQTFRKILVIFRIFHLKFAEALDRKIRRLEARIITNTLVLRQRINQISTILTLILNPELLIRGRVLVGSVIAALDDLLRAITGRGLDFYSSGTRGPGGTPIALANLRQEQEEFFDGITTGVGYYGAVGREAAASFETVRSQLPRL